MVFVHQYDTAWDTDRTDYELAVIDGKREAEAGRPVPWTKRSEHPWWRYVAGETRADVKPVEEYLKHRDGPEGPVRFRLQRIGSPGRWALVRELEEQGKDYSARQMALRLSLTGVDDPRFVGGLDLEGGRRGEPLTDTDLQKLRETYGDEVYEQLGIIAIKCSRSLTEAEKKGA